MATGKGDALASGRARKASYTGYEGVSQDKWNRMWEEEKKPVKPKRRKRKVTDSGS